MRKVLLAGALLAAWPAAADTVRFDLVIRGLRAGALTYAATQTGGRYAVSGRLESTGLFGVVRTMRYDARAEGRIDGRRAEAVSYVENGLRGDRQSHVTVDWSGGTPRRVAHEPPRAPAAHDIDPTAQTGTVDPLSALFVALRDVPAGRECRLTLELFDGRRRTRLVLGEPKPVQGGVACPGEFRRVAGYSPEDIAEKRRFPLTFRFVPIESGRMRVSEVVTDTVWGPARLLRR